MKKLEYVDFQKIYGKEPERDLSFRPNIENLLLKLQEEKHPENIKNYVLKLNQLYLDAIIGGPFLDPIKSRRWKRQETGLNALMRAGVLAVGSYYNGTLEGKADSVMEEIFKAERQILKHSSENYAKSRYLGCAERLVLPWGIELTERLANSQIDTVVPVASDGFEPAFLAADLIGSPQILPLRYSHVSRFDTTVRVPEKSPEDWAQKQIDSKNVLITEGDSERGFSLRKVIDYVLAKNPESITFTVVTPRLHMLPKIREFLQEGVSGRFARYKEAA